MINFVARKVGYIIPMMICSLYSINRGRVGEMRVWRNGRLEGWDGMGWMGTASSLRKVSLRTAVYRVIGIGDGHGCGLRREGVLILVW
jgi:hypothetical protein